MEILGYGPENGIKRQSLIGIEDYMEYYNFLKRNGLKLKDFLPKLRENNITHLCLYLIYDKDDIVESKVSLLTIDEAEELDLEVNVWEMSKIELTENINGIIFLGVYANREDYDRVSEIF